MAAPNDGVTLSDLERRRLREMEDGLARVDGAFVARFASSRGMRTLAAGLVIAVLAFAVAIGTFTRSTPAAFAACLVVAGGMGMVAHGARCGGCSGWVERLRHPTRGS